MDESYLTSLKSLANIDKNPGFTSLLKREEITFVIFIPQENTNKLKFVTTSSDGFIKLNEIDPTDGKL